MITWTESANAALELHLAAIHPTLIAGGVDPAAVAANFRMNIEAELAAAQVSVVSEEEVKRYLIRLNAPPEPPVVSSPGRPATISAIARPSLVWGGRIFNGLFGVVLPLVTLLLEFLSGMCAEFFDPIPTMWHIFAIALVAAANAFGLYASSTPALSEAALRRVARLNAFALGIAVFYALWFLPLSPFALVGIIFFGVGLLPLSPLFSLLVASLLRRSLRRRSRAQGFELPRVWSGLLAGFACLIALEFPGAFQAWAVHATANGSRESQGRALWFLRHAGNDEQLLRGCYANPDAERMAVLQFLFGQTSQTERQQVYYRVTGHGYNSVPAPSHTINLFGRGADRGSQEWVWDDSQGQGQVGQRLKFLNLKESRIDGTLDGDAALGHLEWTLVFRNDHEFQQREARALVQLPAGAVVSRLTLWIDGEEREAAFGGRSQVRQAYQAVVNQRRDPVLVTTKGPDRVLVQCFPIAPKGGEMKLRIGITVPLTVDQLASARLSLPRIIEQNFSATPGLSHAVWIEAKSPLSSALSAYQSNNSKNSLYALRGALTPAQFASPVAGLTVARNPDESRTWARDPRDATRMVTQEIAQQAPTSGPLAIVIDGSREIGASARSLADVLETLPADFPLSLRIAGDDVLSCPVQKAPEVASWLRVQAFTGGQDASAALQAAFDSLVSHGGTLLWIHGTQPVAWGDTTALEQALSRQAGQVHLLAIPALPGANVVLEKLGESTDLAVVPRLGEPKEDFTRVLKKLRDGGFAAIRRTEPAENFSSVGHETTAALTRLWAADEVARLLSGAHPQREAAIRLAAAARLVTSVTGAVVLETKQQYDAAGLNPDESATATSVPEAAPTVVLLVLALIGLGLIVRYRKHRVCQQ